MGDVKMISSDDATVLGALSVDSSRPYFFQSFTPGSVANDLENSLQPYIQTLMLMLETCVSRDPLQLLHRLKAAVGSPDETGDGGT